MPEANRQQRTPNGTPSWATPTRQSTVGPHSRSTSSGIAATGGTTRQLLRLQAAVGNRTVVEALAGSSPAKQLGTFCLGEGTSSTIQRMPKTKGGDKKKKENRKRGQKDDDGEGDEEEKKRQQERDEYKERMSTPDPRLHSVTIAKPSIKDPICVLTFLDSEGHPLFEIEKVPDKFVTGYLGHKKVGTHVLDNRQQTPNSLMARTEVITAYNEWRQRMELEAELGKAQLRLDAVVPQKDVPAQSEILPRLKQLYDKGLKHGKTRGNPKITMIVLLLKKPIILFVGGKPHEISRLYLQKGNDTEMRCYLGDESGAYQRVHTSMTQSKEDEAHTMVQTGDEVVVPNYSSPGNKGTRVGFDSKVKGSPGYGHRDLTPRSYEQCKVQDWLDADDWKEMSEGQKKGVQLLALRFNQALDEVIKDAAAGTLEERFVDKAGENFSVLDDSWLFEGGGKATPEEEFNWQEEQDRLNQDSPKVPSEDEPPKLIPIETTSELKSAIAPERRGKAGDKSSFKFDGVVYAPVVNGISPMGECLWQTLEFYGIPPDVLKKAATISQLPYYEHVDSEKIKELIIALDGLGFSVGISLTMFEYGFEKKGAPVTESINPVGASVILKIALFGTDEDLLGHYVPPVG